MNFMHLRGPIVFIAVAATVWFAWRAFSNARRLNAEIRAFKAEQENQEGPLDPYAALAALYTPDSKHRPDRRP